MSQSQRVEGNRVYCHVCDHEWDRAEGGLQCPACESEFVEIVDSNPRSEPTSPPPIPHVTRPPQPPELNANPWATNFNDNGSRTFEFHAPGGRSTFSFTSRTYTIGGGNIQGSRNFPNDEIGRNFEIMLGNILGHGQRRPGMVGGGYNDMSPFRDDQRFGPTQYRQPPDLFSMLFQGPGQRSPNHPPSPFDLLGAILNPANGQRGDTVYSQEAFDRIMTQLMEQHSTNAPGPAPAAAISSLKKKPVDESMLGNDGEAECSICMDGVKLGDEVTVLPCNHWFHGDCVVSWLREHDTCPHCRKPTASAAETSPQSPSSPSPPSSRRRRLSRRSSSMASPLSPNIDGNRRGDMAFSDSPSGLREARQSYYENNRMSEARPDRPPRERQSSDRSQRSTDNGGSGGSGGVASWIRSRLPFSGQQ